jgi:hypothetical protein
MPSACRGAKAPLSAEDAPAAPSGVDRAPCLLAAPKRRLLGKARPRVGPGASVLRVGPAVKGKPPPAVLRTLDGQPDSRFPMPQIGIGERGRAFTLHVPGLSGA